MDNGCFAASCTAGNLKTQAFPAANRCTVKNVVQEDHDGCEFFFFFPFFPSFLFSSVVLCV